MEPLLAVVIVSVGKLAEPKGSNLMIRYHAYSEPMPPTDSSRDWAAIGMILFATSMLLCLPLLI
jgi:hypothetical protein